MLCVSSRVIAIIVQTTLTFISIRVIMLFYVAVHCHHKVRALIAFISNVRERRCLKI